MESLARGQAVPQVRAGLAKGGRFASGALLQRENPVSFHHTDLLNLTWILTVRNPTSATYEQDGFDDILENALNGRLGLNPYFDIHNHMYFLLCSARYSPSLICLVNVLPRLQYPITPSSPVHIRSEFLVAYSCQYHRCPRSKLGYFGPRGRLGNEKSALVLKNPKVLALRDVSHIFNGDAEGINKGTWTYAVELPQLGGRDNDKAIGLVGTTVSVVM